MKAYLRRFLVPAGAVIVLIVVVTVLARWLSQGSAVPYKSRRRPCRCAWSNCRHHRLRHLHRRSRRWWR